MLREFSVRIPDLDLGVQEKVTAKLSLIENRSRPDVEVGVERQEGKLLQAEERPSAKELEEIG